MKIFHLSVLFITATALSSCAFLESFNSPKVAVEPDYIEKGAKVDIKKFFNGDIEAFGIAQDEAGKIIDTQTIKINGKWDGDKGVIQQNFQFSNGKKDSRTWLITIDSDNADKFVAVGHDVASPGEGKQVGNTIQMLYTLLLSTDSEKKSAKEPINFIDRVYMVDEKSAIMISNTKKGGSSGKVILSLKKVLTKDKESVKEVVKDKEPVKENGSKEKESTKE